MCKKKGEEESRARTPHRVRRDAQDGRIVSLYKEFNAQYSDCSDYWNKMNFEP